MEMRDKQACSTCLMVKVEVAHKSGIVVLTYSQCEECGYATDFDPPDFMWRSGVVECRICSHRETLIWPQSADETNLECPMCGSPTCEPVDFGF